MMFELKLCPFCGSVAEMHEDGDVDGNLLDSVRCKKCYARTDLMESKEQAVAAWNRRVSE